MRFLLLNQFYLPDHAPTGKYLHDLGCVLVERGHEVKVICSQRSYDGSKSFPRNEVLDGVKIRRLPATGFGRKGFLGKLVDYISFYSCLFFALMLDRSKPDVILSLTTPPYIGLLGKLAAWKGNCRHADWIMDLYPDVLFVHGMSGGNGMAGKALKKLNRIQFKGSNPILTLGLQMAAKASAYCSAQPSPVTGVPLWSDPKLAPLDNAVSGSLRVKRGWSKDELVLLYSGNMGVGHRFGEFLEAASKLGSAGPRWVFSGGGKRRKEVEDFAKAHPSARIEFLDYVQHSELCAHLCSANVHLASLDSTWSGLIVPSKLQASFAVGRPVICVGGKNSETAEWINESGGGWVIAENDVEGLLKAIAEANDPEICRFKGANAREFANRNFKIADNCNRISHLLEKGISVPDVILTGAKSVGISPQTAELGNQKC